jgi:hypothetical protein
MKITSRGLNAAEPLLLDSEIRLVAIRPAFELSVILFRHVF